MKSFEMKGSAGYLHLRLSYSFTWSEDLATGRAINYLPEHLLGLSVQSDIPIGPVSFIPAFDMHLVGKRWRTSVRGEAIRHSLEPHVVGNLRMQVKWNMLTFYLEGRNIWNMDYEETAYMKAPGFLLLGGVKVETALPSDG